MNLAESKYQGMSEQFSNEEITPDATDSWVDLLPPNLRPYLRLMRADRPIGTWLLVIPCFWGLGLAALSEGGISFWLSLWYAILFSVGAFVMRGAGCVYNDIVDKDFDAQVERTANRPIPAGLVSMRQAWMLLIGLCLTGLLILIQFNLTTIIVGISSLALVAGYPFMKRITWWPQAWLGLTFNWGVLVGWTAITGSLSITPILAYIAGIFWTLGYDTIYAHQDKEDDALIGVKSTALRLNDETKTWLLYFYVGFVFFISLAGVPVGASHWFFIGLIFPVLHLIWQIVALKKDEPAVCLNIFKSNRETGLMIVLALLMGFYV